jgi:hypothetical protein
MPNEILPTPTTALSTTGLVAILFSLPLSAIASPAEIALQRCQQRVTEELPGINDQFQPNFQPNPQQPNGTILIHWQANLDATGYCRVDGDGTVIEFVNPYAAPRGQRPIETVLAFQTADYTVRIVRLTEQLYMNVYNRKTDRLELNRGLARSSQTEEGTLYTTVLGNRVYQSIVADDQTDADRYRLVILAGRNPIYDEAGDSFSPSRSSPLSPNSVSVPAQN